MRTEYKLSAVLYGLAMLTACFSLSGCFYTGDYDKYADTLAAHSVAESTRISNQAEAIMETVVNTSAETKTESTLLTVIAMMQIERLHFVPLVMVKPTTGMDVLNAVAGNIPIMTMGLTTYKIAERGFEAAGNTNISGETVTVSESFNPTEVHATGDTNTATVPYRTFESTEIAE
ncbi:MAG: hypothetical protein KJ630_19145 [Proteobacteria bacterium]|nr:hypothetical protein [Pseudomonadota bacterium]